MNQARAFGVISVTEATTGARKMAARRSRSTKSRRVIPSAAGGFESVSGVFSVSLVRTAAISLFE
jgi:hypothetical protein